MNSQQNRVQRLIAVVFFGLLAVSTIAFGQVRGSPPLGQPTTAPMGRISGQEQVIKVPMPDESVIKKIEVPNEGKVKRIKIPIEGQVKKMRE